MWCQSHHDLPSELAEAWSTAMLDKRMVMDGVSYAMVIEAWLTAMLGSVWKWKVELRHEADLMEQTDDNVRLLGSTIWSKPGHHAVEY